MSIDKARSSKLDREHKLVETHLLNYPEMQDAIVLYSEQPAFCTQDTTPRIRLDLLAKIDLPAIIKLLEIFFPISDPGPSPMITFTCNAAYITREDSLVASIVPSCSDLVKTIPAINAWLDEWACNPLRVAPDHPVWAQDLTMKSRSVKAISALFVQQLASQKTRNIFLQDVKGNTGTLHVPPKALLVAPSHQHTEESEAFKVHSTQKMVRLQTPGGQQIICSSGAFQSGENASIILDSCRLVRTKIRTSRLVKLATLEDDKEGNQ